MKRNLVILCGIALIIWSSAMALSAQERQPAPDRAAIEREMVIQGPNVPPGRNDLIFLATEMSFGGKLVKGAPYSAQAVTESIQTLVDGNRIVNKTTAAIYRDSEGRTRREQTYKAIGPFANLSRQSPTIFISDPVAGTSHTLNPDTQTAQKMPAMRFRVRDSKLLSEELKPGDSGKPGLRFHVEGGQVELQSAQTGETQRIMIGPGVAEKRNLEAGVSVGVIEPRNPNSRTEALGKQNINGVEAEGSRTVTTIPAGEIGNERPIEIVSERWYSPELGLLVMTRHSDPRFGENTYQLTNINRAEPARELFEVPAGYTIAEGPSPPMMPAPLTGIQGGVLNGKARSLPRPAYPTIARQANASGSVVVQVSIDEGGNVISAQAVSGHPLLRGAAVAAAREARFSPTRLKGQPVKVHGTLVYTFVLE